MKNITFVCLISVFVWLQPVLGCDLIDHEWELIGKIDLPVSYPITPVLELEAIQNRFSYEQIGSIIWVLEKAETALLPAALLKLSKSWILQKPWKIISKKDLGKLPQPKQTDKQLIVGSDQTKLKIAIFRDINAASNCFQIILMQEQRIRLAINSTERKFAQQMMSRAWVSLIFYQLPTLNKLISFSIYPVFGHRKYIFDNIDFVEKLLSLNLVKRQQEQFKDNDAMNIPKL